MSLPDAVNLWSELKSWYEQHFPEALQTLNQGVQEDALAEFDRELKQETGRGFPSELRAIYLENDGQEDRVLCGMFFGLEFLSVENALSHWREWRDIANDEEMLADSGLDEIGSSYPVNAVQSAYASAGWLPFAHDGNGNFLGIDLQPGFNGRLGQIINCGRDEEAKYVVADSLEAFLGWLVTQHREGNYLIAEHDIDNQIERRVEVLHPRRQVFLDAIPILFG